MNILRTLAGIVLAISVLAPLAAHAQTANGGLKGITNFGLQIERLDSDSAACNITETMIVKAVRAGSKGTPFKYNGYNYIFKVSVSTLFRGLECFSSVDVAAYYQGRVALPEYPKGAYSKVVLWEDGTVVISHRKTNGSEIAKIIEKMTRAMVDDWRRDNS
jgi:hypothetical protein